ncbi:MAG: hypothetical protein ABSG56_05045 [Bryobacteraceae bacterium]|jgi:hypothetical protein
MATASTYSVKANCAGVIDITTGGSATLNLSLYDGGTDFLVSGSDASYTYAGGGNTQPAALTANAVSDAEDGTGLPRFDWLGDVTVNITMSTAGAAPSALTLTGSNTVSSGCLGSAALKNAGGKAYVMSFSIYNATVNNAAFDATLARASIFLIACGCTKRDVAAFIRGTSAAK